MSERGRPGDGTSSEARPAEGPGSDPGARVIGLATPEWCWSRLYGTAEGLLSARHLRTAGLVVGFTVSDQGIVMPLAPDPDLMHLLAGVEVTLGLSGGREDEERWVVRVTGTAVLSVQRATDTLDACRSSHPARRAGARRSNALVLPVDRLRGYHETRSGL